MDKGSTPVTPTQNEKRPGRGKVTPRVSVEETVINAEIPPGCRFKGHQSFLVQDLVISVRATRYQRERWVTPDGRTILAPLPEGIDGHFGPDLRRFVLMQYHQGQSTMPRLLALLRSMGIAISKRQLVRLLNENHQGFIAEAQNLPPLQLIDKSHVGFPLQERALAWNPPTITGQTAVAADDTVARYRQRHRVGRAGTRHGTHRARITDHAGDLAVAARLAGRDAAQCEPHTLLERRAAQVERQVERPVSAPPEIRAPR